MSEKKLQKRIYHITILTVIISALLVLCSGLMIFSLMQTDRESYAAQMQSYINEYKINLERQFDSDIEAMETLAAFVSGTGILEHNLSAKQSSVSARSEQFLRLGYSEKDSNIIQTSFTLDAEGNRDLTDLSPEVQESIKRSWEGETVTSNLYMDRQLKQKVIAYTVPVTDADGQTVGALVGVRGVDAYEEILNQATLSKIEIAVDWIRQNGKIVTWSECSPVKEKVYSIYQDDYIAQEDRIQIRKDMEMGRSSSGKLQYEGESYMLYLTPLDRNGWYLLCIDWDTSLKSPIYFTLFLVVGIFTLVFLLSIVFMIYALCILRKNYRDLIRLAYYDRLTGIYNLERFSQELAERMQTNISELGGYTVVALNLRHFRYINEIFGRQQADILLCRIAELLKVNLSKGELCCRYMKDQFFLLVHTVDPMQVEDRVRKLMKRAGAIAHEINRSYPIHLYAGAAPICTFSQTSESATAPEKAVGKKLADGTLQRAEFALRRALESAEENAFQFFDDKTEHLRDIQSFIESHMKQALEDGEFCMYLQPQKNLETGRIEDAEVLVRWIRADGTMMYPDQFIPLFEKNGFCAQLDLYMVEQACRSMRIWLDRGLPPIRMSVNQSKLLFYQTDYVERLCEITERYRIPGSQITLEILEGLAVESIDELNKTITLLRSKGFRISLDDFGSGYSSLNLLGNIAIDEVKLDRGFLLEENGRGRNRILMKNVIRMARALGIETVVEGVETEEQAEFVRKAGSTYGQGYYYGRPVSCETFEEILWGSGLKGSNP